VLSGVEETRRAAQRLFVGVARAAARPGEAPEASWTDWLAEVKARPKLPEQKGTEGSGLPVWIRPAGWGGAAALATAVLLLAAWAAAGRCLLPGVPGQRRGLLCFLGARLALCTARCRFFRYRGSQCRPPVVALVTFVALSNMNSAERPRPRRSPVEAPAALVGWTRRRQWRSCPGAALSAIRPVTARYEDQSFIWLATLAPGSCAAAATSTRPGTAPRHDARDGGVSTRTTAWRWCSTALPRLVEAALHARDWGLENADDRDAVREHACDRLQAALADRHGLREVLAVTTDWRAYYDALPADPLADDGDPAAPLARQGWRRATEGPWAAALQAALEATAAVARAAAPFAAAGSLWARGRGPSSGG
jgi:hypothetical protein